MDVDQKNQKPKRSFNVLTHRNDIYLICSVNIRI